MTPVERADPYPANRFTVEVDDLGSVGCSEVRGLALAVDPDAAEAESVTADAPRTRSRDRGFLGTRGLGDRISRSVAAATEELRPRPTTAPTLELRRGVTDDRTLWDWMDGWVRKRVEPRTVRVYLLDRRGDPARGWGFEAAVPVAWSGPELLAGRDATAVETLELAHDGISAISP